MTIPLPILVTRPADCDRLTHLVKVSLDIVVFCSSQGNSVFQDTIRWIRAAFPQLEVIAENAAAREQAANTTAADADGLRAGMGLGSIRITQEVMAVG